MSNRAPGEQTEANGRTHDCARGATTVLQAQKGCTDSSTAVLLTLHGRTVARAGTHGRVDWIRGIPSVGGFKSSSIRVFLSLSQTPLGGNKLVIRLD